MVFFTAENAFGAAIQDRHIDHKAPSFSSLPPALPWLSSCRHAPEQAHAGQMQRGLCSVAGNAASASDATWAAMHQQSATTDWWATAHWLSWPHKGQVLCSDSVAGAAQDQDKFVERGWVMRPSLGCAPRHACVGLLPPMAGQAKPGPVHLQAMCIVLGGIGLHSCQLPVNLSTW